MDWDYVIITPAKNEERFLPAVADSVISQEIRPQKWMIVNDGSTDRTGFIIKSLEAAHDWILGVENPLTPMTPGRRIGGQAAIYSVLESLDVGSFDYIVRMDADVLLDRTFFSRVFGEFEAQPELGIASGVCYTPGNGGLLEEKHPRFHTRGPLKVYRKQCFLDIGRLDREEGWDTIDEIKASMLGWKTWSFPELKLVHLRKTQTASGSLRGLRNVGRTAYYVGYHPLYLMARTIKHLFLKPYVVGGIEMLSGYLEGFLKSFPRSSDKDLMIYLRKQQINRLMGKETIWK
jgi:poly-beta-1,6-N-acetyl-D-glucosamine synthase